MRKKLKQLIGILLTLVMVLGQMPGMSLTAYAAGEKAYAAYDVTTETNKTKSGNDLTALQVTFNDRKWYIIDDNSSSAKSGTVTLLSADTSFGTKTFNNEKNSNRYSTSQVKTYLDSMTGTGGAFAGVADAIETVNLTTNKYNSTNVYETVNGVKLYLLSTEEAKSLPENVLKAKFTEGHCNYNEWWLRSPGDLDYRAAYVHGFGSRVYDYGYYVANAFGVRPALKLNLESVTFSPKSKTFKCAQTITASNVTATYGDTDKKVEATTYGNGAISYAVKEGSEDYIDVDSTTGALTIKKVGTATVIVTAAETDAYTQATKEVTVTIGKANAVAATVTANNRTYDGTEKPLVTVTGEATGGEMQYALGTASKATQTYTTSIPTATGAGTYYVWYKSVGNDYYFDSELGYIVVTIGEAPAGGNKSSADKDNKNDNKHKYSNEWVDGKWYNADGICDYAGVLEWKNNSTGWWVEDSEGWYPVSQWQKIDGIWYYFNETGYMASGEYYNGYWFNSDGSWDEAYYLTWKKNSTGWWVEDKSGWWPSSQWLKIDGSWYYFDSSGYMVTSQYVDGYWIGSDGVCG